jgi:hypothetical protein
VKAAPRLTIVEGPNGAGKSTRTRTAGLRGHLIDPDAIANRSTTLIIAELRGGVIIWQAPELPQWVERVFRGLLKIDRS